MRNRRFFLIGIAVATLFLLLTSVASVIAVNRPSSTKAITRTGKIKHTTNRVTGAVIKQGVYRFKKQDFDAEKMHPIWKGEKPKTVPAPFPLKDRTI